MSKFQVLKAVVTNVRVREFFNLLWVLLKNYAEKQYLQDSTLVDDLEETYNRVDQRSRPLSEETVETLEKLAFTKLQVVPAEINSVGANHYYEAKAEDAK